LQAQASVGSKFATEHHSMQARIFVAEGVSKVRITGGEPTVRRDLVDIATQLAALPGLQTLAMTTNGLVLQRHLPALKQAGVSALNISLDTLRADRFVQLTRHSGHERVLAAIHAAVAMGFAVKVNVVVMRGVNDDELLDFVDMTRTLPVNVRFIEFMPFDDNTWSQKKLVRLPPQQSTVCSPSSSCLLPSHAHSQANIQHLL
jgi:GTP 3',8-cyclase